MKRGHVYRTKKERKHAPDWDRELAEAHSHRSEAEWQAKPQGKEGEPRGVRSTSRTPSTHPARYKDESCKG